MAAEANIPEELNNFYWGIHWPPYLVATFSVRVGSLKDYKRALLVNWWDPDDLPEQWNTSVLTEEHLKMTLIEVRLRDLLCCDTAMLNEGFGHGCAHDMDVILQWALFGEVTYG